MIPWLSAANVREMTGTFLFLSPHWHDIVSAAQHMADNEALFVKFKQTMFAVFSTHSFYANCFCTGWSSQTIHPPSPGLTVNLHNKHTWEFLVSVKLRATVRSMHIGYISQADIIKNDCKCNGNAMHWKVRFFKIPFRKEVFIFVKAAYECLSPEEGLAAPQPVITSNRLFFSFLFFPATSAEVPRRNMWFKCPSQPFTKGLKSCKRKRGFKEKWWKGLALLATAATFIPWGCWKERPDVNVAS